MSPDAEDDVRAIHALYSRWFGAMEDGDPEALVELVTDDVILKGGGGPAVRGKDALEDALRDFLAEFTEEVEYSVEEVEVVGDRAWARIDESTRVIPRDGRPPVTVTGMHLSILRRDDDGRWRVARDVGAAGTEEPE